MTMASEIKTETKNGVITYTTKAGYKLTSKVYAETLAEAIEHTKNQMATTTDMRKKKRLSEKLRNIKLWIALHPDVRAHMK
jgi:hypothetical protein